MNDTITALATAWGYSAIGIIRVSGPDAHKLTDSIFKPHNQSSESFSPEPFRMYRGNLINPQTSEPYDDVMICYMKTPRSYTGENMVEIYCHGSPVIIQMTLKYYQGLGASMAEPGEFTRRAFLNGKMDLLQAESVNQVIHSRTVQSEKAAYRILQGSLSRVVNTLKDDVVHLLSQLHANIDFSAEMEGIPVGEWKKTSSLVRAGVQRLLSSYEYGSRLQSGLNVVIAGAPNAGKSSLFNALLVEDRALVTSIPGTTRDTLREIINIRGIPITLMDTAGLRHTSDMVEKMGIDLTRKVLDEADLVLVLLDGGRPFSSEDKKVLKMVNHKPQIVVLNKADILNTKRGEQYSEMFPEAVSVSSMTGEGLEKLNDRIYSTMITVQPQSSEVAITSVRHKIALESALKALDEFQDGLENGLGEELLLVDLQKVLNDLQLITGEIATDDILDRIFDQFCLGK